MEPQTPRAMPADDSAGRPVGRKPVKLSSIIRGGLLLAGAVLTVWSFFASWLNLYTGTYGLPREQHVGPWWLLRHGAPSGIDAWMVLLTLGMVVSAVVLAFPRVRPSGWLIGMALLASGISLCAWFFAVVALPAGLSFSYPSYDTTYDSGAWIALAGDLCVFGAAFVATGFFSDSSSLPAGDASRVAPGDQS